MIPCRILVIAPYESMKNILLLICKDRPEVRLTVMVGDLGEGARLVQEINEEEFDIVISRGGTAEVLRSVVSIPVVEIQLSSYDVLSALKLAENYTGRYALVAYPNIARMATLLCSVLQYDVPIYPIAQGDTLENIQMIPALQKDCSTNALDGAEGERVINYLQSLSENITIDAEGYISSY